jgi:DNA-binding MarR family transcriptional regulator
MNLRSHAEHGCATCRSRRQAILDLDGLHTETGMRTRDIADDLRYAEPDTSSTLKGLTQAGLVELIPGSRPQRWRLALAYRSSR